MIEQKAIFEAAQTAFEAHHPKFPFPKKHNLDEQTDEFKKAFLVFSTDINAMADRDINILVAECNRLRDVTVQKIDEAANARLGEKDAFRLLEKTQTRLQSVLFWSTISWCVAAAACFVVFLLTLN